MKTLQLVFFLEFSFATKSTCIEKTCNEASATSFGSKKLPLKNAAENPVPRSFFVAAGYVTKIQQVSISGFPHWILGSLDSRAIWRPF